MEIETLTEDQLVAINELVEALLELYAPFFDAYYELALIICECRKRSA